MKYLHISEDIIPLGEFKARAASIIKELAASQRSLVITQNGRPAFVVISPAEFDKLTEHRAFLSAVNQGLDDTEAGRIVSDDELKQRLDEEFGTLE